MKLVDKIIKGILVTLLIVAIVSVIYLVVFHNPGEDYTEFYILDYDNNTTHYPTNVSQYSVEKINIGIKNEEHTTMNYTIKVKKDNYTIAQYNRTLKNNEETLTPYYFDETSRIGDNQKLQFELYKGNISEPYRTLNLRYNVTP